MKIGIIGNESIGRSLASHLVKETNKDKLITIEDTVVHKNQPLDFYDYNFQPSLFKHSSKYHK